MRGEGCVSRGIPCHLVETRQLEQYLERMAADGKQLRELRNAGITGIFDDAEPRKYHYCADVYYRPLKKGELESDEFAEYTKTCRECGWEYVCACGNIVIFRSSEENRPPELQTDPELKKEILKEVTLKAERKRAVMSVGRLLLCGLPLLPALYRGMTYGWPELSRLDIPPLLLFLIFPLMVLWEAAEYGYLAHLLHSDKPLPSRVRFWDKPTIALLYIMLLALLCAVEGVWFRLRDTVLCGVIGCALIAALLCFDRYEKKKKQVAARITGGASMIFIIGVILACAVLYMMLFSLPRSGSYRFMIREGYGAGGSRLYEKEEGESYSAAIYPQDVGIEIAEEQVSELCHDNVSHYASLERIVYVTDTDSYGDFRDVVRDLRYTGTMTAVLRDEADTDKFIKSKGLGLEGAARLALLPEFESYLLPSGKEMVHIHGRLVVIHFLNRYDRREMDVGGREQEEAVAGRLRNALALYGPAAEAD